MQAVRSNEKYLHKFKSSMAGRHMLFFKKARTFQNLVDAKPSLLFRAICRKPFSRQKSLHPLLQISAKKLRKLQKRWRLKE